MELDKISKVTIFGLAGTGTTSVGELVANALGSEFLSSGNLFRKKAVELGIEVSKLEKICLTNPEYDLELDKCIEKSGKEKNNLVVESRLAYHFIPDSIKIKFVCDYATRIQRVARRQNVPTSIASEETNFREMSAEKRYRKYYGIKKLAPDKQFHLIIDTSRRSAEETAAIIVSKFNLSKPKGGKR